MNNSKTIANTVMMVEPIAFGFNESAAETNAFQNRVEGTPQEIQNKALIEFQNYVDLLRSHGIKVEVFKDNNDNYTPDSIFPNNWFATSPHDRSFVTFPMANKNRADERREDIINHLVNTYNYELDQSILSYEPKKLFLEGTGSMVLDHVYNIAYACLSPRTHKEVFNDWCKQSGYKPVSFYAHGSDGTEVYHTNVIMTMADEYVIICLESILEDAEREMVIDELVKSSKRSIIDITLEQMNHFAGNMLQLQNEEGKKFLVMSQTAKESLTKEQKEAITNTFGNTIIAPDINLIETIGGGSARCMIAEIF